MRSKFLSLIESYIHDRRQLEKVPQGSILEPTLLFLPYIKGIFCNHEETTYYVYTADSATKTKVTKTRIDCNHQQSLNNVNVVTSK